MRGKYLALGAVAALVLWACGSETTETEECVPTLSEEIVQPGDTVYVTVAFRSGIREEDREFVRSLGGEITYEYTTTLPGRMVISIPVEALEALEANPRVQFITVEPGDTVLLTVEFWSGVREEDREFVRSLGGEITYEYTALPRMAISIPVEALEALDVNPRVKFIWVNKTGEFFPLC